MSHTEGKLRYQEESDVYTHIIRSEQNKYVASCPQGSGGTNEADARRIVACWNACAEISTDTLEMHGFRTVLADLQRQINEQWKERDELLATLRKVVEWNDKYPSHRIYSYDRIIQIAQELDTICDEARSLLAKYKEAE